MVRENRVKTYTYSISSLTAASTGLLDAYTDHAINGTIQKLFWDAGNHAATGSLIVTVSGIGESILSFTSGTLYGMTSEDFTKYLRYATATSTGSPIALTDAGAQITVNDIIRVVGSGLGNGKSGLGFTIYYI